MSGAVFLSYWLFGMRCLALEPAGSWVEPGVGFTWIPTGEHMLINIPWAWELPHGPPSCTQCSHSGDPGPSLGWGTKSPQAVLHCQWKSKEKKKKEKETDKQNPRQITKTSKKQQQHNTHTHKKKKTKEERKQTNRHTKSKTNDKYKTEESGWDSQSCGADHACSSYFVLPSTDHLLCSPLIPWRSIFVPADFPTLREFFWVWGPPLTFSFLPGLLVPFLTPLFCFSFFCPTRLQGDFSCPSGCPKSSANVQQVLWENCSIYRCILDVPVMSDEFHILLFHHLDSSLLLKL